MSVLAPSEHGISPFGIHVLNDKVGYRFLGYKQYLDRYLTKYSTNSNIRSARQKITMDNRIEAVDKLLIITGAGLVKI